MQPENNTNPEQTPIEAPAQEPVSQPTPDMSAPAPAPAEQAPTTNPVAPAPGEQPAPMPTASVSMEDPGKTMGIVALVLALLGFNLISLVLGFMAMSKSKKAGHKNTLGLVAVILSVLSMIAIFALFALGLMAGLTEA